MAFNHKHLIDITEYSADDIMLILETATKFKEVNERKIKKLPTLKGFTVVNMFNEPSTRTRSSFEIAEKRLSCDSLNFGGSSTSSVKGESQSSAASVETLSSYKIDMIIVRDKRAGVPYKITQKTNAHVIDAGDGKHQHPTQALLDLYSIWQHKGDLDKLHRGRRGRHRALPRVRFAHPGAEDHGRRSHRHRAADAYACAPGHSGRGSCPATILTNAWATSTWSTCSASSANAWRAHRIPACANTTSFSASRRSASAS